MLINFADLAVPNYISCLIYEIVMQVNLMFIGSLNDVSKLAAIGLVNVVTGIMGLSVLLGINGSLTTLTSQAYGANNMQLCGVLFNRARAILVVVYTPIAIVFFFCEDILLFL